YIIVYLVNKAVIEVTKHIHFINMYDTLLIFLNMFIQLINVIGMLFMFFVGKGVNLEMHKLLVLYSVKPRKGSFMNCHLYDTYLPNLNMLGLWTRAYSNMFGIIDIDLLLFPCPEYINVPIASKEEILFRIDVYMSGRTAEESLSSKPFLFAL
ncbi:hypothetical protein ACJX0J_011903, partial [Zea mays]